MGNCVQAPAHDVAIKHRSSGCDNSSDENSGFRYTKNTCALEYWDPVKLIGEGSISTIHIVRKRPERVEIPYHEKIDIMARVKKTSAGETDDTENDEEEECLYALKSIMKDHIRNDKLLQEMRDEILIMSSLHHPNIIRVVEGYERKRHVYLIMELCRGGDLSQIEGTTEQHAKAICRQLLSAVGYMHAQGVVHRDLKLENIMFATPKRKASEIKIIDFGLATKYLSSDYKKLTDKVGTIYTMAPQVMQGVYDNKCDLWSIGVITYMLLSGSNPFWGPKVDLVWAERKLFMIDRIMRGDYMRMEQGKWDDISEDAKKFVKSLLRMDPKLRPSADQALKSAWMKKTDDHDSETPLRISAEQKRLRTIRLAILMVMKKTSSAEIQNFQQILQRYDAEETGTIVFGDLRKALAETGKYTESDLDDVLPQFEETGEYARIDHADFIMKALERRGRVETERITETIQDLDITKNGKISIQKLRDRVCGLMRSECNDCCGAIPSEWVKELCSLGDDDGEVDVNEVLRWFGKKTGQIDSFPEEEVELGKEAQQLATPSNASIPGGRCNPDAKQLFIYDEGSTSMRRIVFE